MSFTRLSIRRFAAISIWSVLILLTGLSVELSVVTSAFVVALVSLGCNLALVLFVSPQSETTTTDIPSRIGAVVISMAVSFAWAILIGRADPLLLAASLMIACVVNSVAWQTLLSPVPNTAALSSVSPRSSVENPVGKSAKNPEAPPLFLDFPDLRIHEHDLSEFDQISHADSEPSSDERTQWFTRSITADGEVIEGGFRIDFAEGQRDVTVHVSFCPPLGTVPEMVTEDLDGHDLEIRAAAVFPFGARLTVRRPAGTQSAQAVSCRIGYVAFSAIIRQVA